MKRSFIYTSLILVALFTAAAFLAAEQFTTMPNGLKYKDLKIGEGKIAQQGATAVIHFVGWLDDNGQRGKEIYNSRRDKRPVSFVVGTDKVMKGWSQGVTGMRPGGTRMVIVPPELGYGAKSVENAIPAHARMHFLIELLEVK